jgi:acetyl esterase/lipase
MPSSLHYDPGFLSELKANNLESFLGAEPLPIDDVEARRQRLANLTARRSGPSQVPPSIEVINYNTKAGGTDIRLRLYRPKDKLSAATTAAVIFVHGGGYISSTIDQYDASCAAYSLQTSLPFLAVDYRRAPEHKYPIALHDVTASLAWLHSHAAELNVDPDRIVLMGSSAGAGLAAAACIENLGSNLKIAKQVLIAPMLDCTNLTLKIPELKSLQFWNHNDNATGWRAYLGDGFFENPDLLPATASPAKLEDAKGMPRLYLEVGGLDIFVAEDLQYAMKHVQAGVSVECHVWEGLPHGFDSYAAGAEIVKKARERRLAAIMAV